MRTSNFQPRTFFDLSDFIWRDLFDKINSVWEVLPNLEQYIAQKIGKQQFVLGEKSTIEKTALIQGKALIGAHTQINHGAFLRGNVIIGDNCHIGHCVELKNCIVLNNTNIAHLNYIGDSIVGSNVNISGGAMLANFRFDKKPVTVKIGGNKLPTHLAKFGAVVGDGSQIGVNAVLNPGTVLGKETIVYPLVSMSGYHREHEIIKI